MFVSFLVRFFWKFCFRVAAQKNVGHAAAGLLLHECPTGFANRLGMNLYVSGKLSCFSCRLLVARFFFCLLVFVFFGGGPLPVSFPVSGTECRVRCFRKQVAQEMPESEKLIPGNDHVRVRRLYP